MAMESLWRSRLSDDKQRYLLRDETIRSWKAAISALNYWPAEILVGIKDELVFSRFLPDKHPTNFQGIPLRFWFDKTICLEKPLIHCADTITISREKSNG